MRRIPFSLLDHYTFGIDIYFVTHEEQPPPTDLEIFRNDAEKIRALALSAGELEELRCAIDFALTHDDRYLGNHFDLSLAEIINSENYQPEEVLKEILAYYRKVIWPDAPPPDAAAIADVEMVTMGLDEWRRQRAA